MDGGKDYEKSLVEVLTLEDTIKAFGDEGKTIHYLKVDVEGHELKAIHNWLDSGILEVVQQIGLELHTGYDYIEKNGILSFFKSFFLGQIHLTFPPYFK